MRSRGYGNGFEFDEISIMQRRNWHDGSCRQIVAKDFRVERVKNSHAICANDISRNVGYPITFETGPFDYPLAEQGDLPRAGLGMLGFPATNCQCHPVLTFNHYGAPTQNENLP